MRDYGIVRSAFWVGDTGRRLRQHGRDVQLLALYLVTAPSSSMIGLYYLPKMLMAHETGMSPELVERSLVVLSREDFAHYDDPNEVVYLPEMAAHQVGPRLSAGDKRCKAIWQAAQLHRSSRYYPAFVARYRDPFHFPPETACPIEGPSHGASKGGGHPSVLSCPDPDPVLDPASVVAREAVVRTSGRAPAPRALDVLLTSAGARYQGEGEPGRVRLGKRAATATGLPASQERAWLQAWSEVGERYGEAELRRLGEALAARAIYRSRPISVSELCAKLPDLLAQAQEWDGEAPEARGDDAEPEVRVEHKPFDMDKYKRIRRGELVDYIGPDTSIPLPGEHK